MGLEKRNYNTKYIKKLIDAKSTEITSPASILEEERRFYHQLYSSKNLKSDESNKEFLNNSNIPKLMEIDKQIFETPLKIEEIGKALKQLKNDKSLGSDGFTTNFYKNFWPDFKNKLIDYFKYSSNNK